MLPPQLLTSPVGDATTKPPGRLSEKLRLVSVVNVGFGLVTVKVSVVDWPIRMLGRAEDLAHRGRRGRRDVDRCGRGAAWRLLWWTKWRWSGWTWCPPRSP